MSSEYSTVVCLYCGEECVKGKNCMCRALEIRVREIAREVWTEIWSEWGCERARVIAAEEVSKHNIERPHWAMERDITTEAQRARDEALSEAADLFVWPEGAISDTRERDTWRNVRERILGLKAPPCPRCGGRGEHSPSCDAPRLAHPAPSPSPTETPLGQWPKHHGDVLRHGDLKPSPSPASSGEEAQENDTMNWRDNPTYPQWAREEDAKDGPVPLVEWQKMEQEIASLRRELERVSKERDEIAVDLAREGQESKRLGIALVEEIGKRDTARAEAAAMRENLGEAEKALDRIRAASKVILSPMCDYGVRARHYLDILDELSRLGGAKEQR